MDLFILSAGLTCSLAVAVTLWVLRRPTPQPATNLLPVRTNDSFRLRVSFVDAEGTYHHENLFLSFDHYWDCWPGDCNIVEAVCFALPLRSREEVYGE